MRFDVGKIRYTTLDDKAKYKTRLRFDVGKIRYTTISVSQAGTGSCGLM